MKRLTFVSGKGGVGKTTVSLALAFRAAARGERVLLVEADSEEQVAELLGRSPTGPQETELFPNLYGINVQPKKSFEEYVLLQIRSHLLYRAIFENRFVRNFIEATPGLADLMTVGKIYSLRDRYDRIIVDAPATGHGLALLQIAGIVSSAVRVGPLRTHAAAINELLHDPQRAEIVIVTLPEEMPIAEALEMRQKIEADRFPLKAIVLNQAVASPLGRGERSEFERLSAQQRKNGLLRAMTLKLAEADRTSFYRETLKRLKIPLIEVPFLYTESFGKKEVERVADSFP